MLNSIECCDDEETLFSLVSNFYHSTLLVKVLLALISFLKKQGDQGKYVSFYYLKGLFLLHPMFYDLIFKYSI